MIGQCLPRLSVFSKNNRQGAAEPTTASAGEQCQTTNTDSQPSISLLSQFTQKHFKEFDNYFLITKHYVAFLP